MLRIALALLGGFWAGEALSHAQELPDFTVGARPFPSILRPYVSRRLPRANLTNTENLQSAIQDGKLRLSMDALIRAVVENNLEIAAARYNSSIAQTDLLRARSGSSPRGVDAVVIPNEVFAGAVGGSILGGAAGGGGGGANNAGGITGSASQVTVRPSGVFDPSLNVAFSVDHTSSPLNSLVVAGVPTVTNATGAFSVNYVQSFQSGTSLTVSYGMQRRGSTQLHLLYNPAFTPGFTATISQPLLNGFGLNVNRALIKVAENEQKIEREAFRQQVITALTSAKGAYWDLVAARESVRAAESALAAAEQLAENNRQQEKVGTMARLDVVTAESQVASSRRDLIVAQTNLQVAELQLKAMFSKSLNEPLASATIETTDLFPDPEEAKLPALEQAVATANANRPEVSIARGNIKNQEDVAPFVHNSLLPNLNVFGLVSTVGLYNVLGTSFTEAVQFKYPQYAFGVTLTFPLRNRQAQADEIRSRLELQQSKDTLVRTQNQIDLAVQSALIAATQTRAQVAAARQATRLEQQKLDAEQQKLQAGLSTSYNVVLQQRDLLTAQLAEVQARDAYAKARVALDQAMGTTLEADRIDLDAALRGRLR